MHIGFRYHIASLIAVFFSLVLGILIGSSLFQDDRLVKEQDILISELESRFAQMQVTTSELQAEVEQRRKREELLARSWRQISQIFVNNRLVGREIVVVRNGNEPLLGLEEILKEAGGTIRTVVEADNDTDWEINLRQMRSEMTDHQPILVLTTSERLPPTTSELIKDLVDQGWMVGITQPYGSDYHPENLATQALIVDFADTLPGQVALVQGLSQSLCGHYGTGRQATALFPEPDLVAALEEALSRP